MIAAGLLAGSILGGAAINAFGKKDSVEQKPLLTPWQSASQEELLNFSQTGRTPWGSMPLSPYSGSLGNYNMTGLETQGQGKLAQTLTQGTPSIFQSGTGALANMLNTNNYDPNNDGGVYKGLTAGLDFNQSRAIDAAKQGAAFQGNLYGQNINRNIGDITAQTSNAKSGILAQLYQNFTNQKLQAAGTAVNAGTAENNINLSQVDASQKYGALARTLQDQQAKDAYAAWQNQQAAEFKGLGVVENLAGQNANFGVSSVPVPNPWNQLLNTTAQVGGYLYGMNGGGGGGGATSSTAPNTMTQAPIVGPAQGPQANWGQYPFNPYGGY